MTAVKIPAPSIHAGARAATSAYSRSILVGYGDERAAERDAIWQVEIDRIKRTHGAELVEFIGIDPVSITAGAHQPMIPDSWRFGFHQPDGGLLRFQRMDSGPLVAWEAVAPILERLEADRAARALTQGEPAGWRSALKFYADKSHFMLADEDAWDTVSGEPSNYWCDEAGTATMEDGTVAAMALAGTPLPDEDDESPAPQGTAA